MQVSRALFTYINRHAFNMPIYLKTKQNKNEKKKKKKQETEIEK